MAIAEERDLLPVQGRGSVLRRAETWCVIVTGRSKKWPSRWCTGAACIHYATVWGVQPLGGLPCDAAYLLAKDSKAWRTLKTCPMNVLILGAMPPLDF